MPSDPRTDRALAALAPARERFFSAVVTAAEQVRAYLHDQGCATPAREAGHLGAFAEGRIDPARFSAVLSPAGRLEPASVVRLKWALETLQETASVGERLLCVDVAPGSDLRDAVGAALARIGRAFGAAQTVELLRGGRFDPHLHGGLLDELPFARWNRAERQIAPPLVVEVDGRDLRAGGLAEFLDGAVRVALVVRGACPPAPLIRLVTPGTLVAQAAEESVLGRLAAFAGPGVVALVPESAARFSHDPAGGAAPGQRLRVDHLPTEEIRRPLGGQSAGQQAEELAQLATLSALAEGAVGPEMEEPMERLSEWLLRQADLPDPL